MGRSEIRDLVRRAQAAEVSGDFEQAVRLLGQAAQIHFDQGEMQRASSLWRHCLRLTPGRPDLREFAERAEAAMPAEPEAGRAGFEVPRRGPTPVDPTLDCWCSFCCRPKGEVGPMVAGPAGAFICSSCIGAAADIVGIVAAKPPSVEAESVPPPEPQAPVGAQAADAGADIFIEAAVVLSKEVGWSLTEIRSLSAWELRRALEKVEKLRAGE